MKDFFEAILGPDFRTAVSALIATIGSQGILWGPEKYKWIFAIASGVGTIGLGMEAKDRRHHSTLEEVEAATREAEAKQKAGK